jgi:hypothetical protein
MDIKEVDILDDQVNHHWYYSSKAKMNRIIFFTKENLLILFIFLVVILFRCPLLLQNDTFYTIKVGEHIINHGLTTKDAFTFHEGINYTSPHWFYDIVIYLIFSIGGFFSVYLSTIIFSLILASCLYFGFLKLYGHRFVAFFVVCVIIFMIDQSLTARAQLITYILFVLEVLILELSRRKKINNLFLTSSLMAISIAIVNVHCATWVVFFILFMPYFSEHVLSYFCSSTDDDKDSVKIKKLTACKNENFKVLFFVFMVCILTGFISPTGILPYTYLYDTYQSQTVNFISEHLPLVPFTFPRFLFFISSILTLLIFTRLKISVSQLLMFLGLTLMALMSVRQTMLLFLISGFLLCDLLTRFFMANNPQRIDFYNSNIFTLKGTIVTLLFMALVSYNGINNNLKDPSFDHDYPVEAVEYLTKHVNNKDQLRVFAMYDDGSYLLFKGFKVFIDSRADLYTLPFNKKKDYFNEYSEFVNLSKNISSFIDEYQLTHLIIRNKSLPINTQLTLNTHLKEVYKDDVFTVYQVI